MKIRFHAWLCENELRAHGFRKMNSYPRLDETGRISYTVSSKYRSCKIRGKYNEYEAFNP